RNRQWDPVFQTLPAGRVGGRDVGIELPRHRPLPRTVPTVPPRRAAVRDAGDPGRALRAAAAGAHQVDHRLRARIRPAAVPVPLLVDGYRDARWSRLPAAPGLGCMHGAVRNGVAVRTGPWFTDGLPARGDVLSGGRRLAALRFECYPAVPPDPGRCLRLGDRQYLQPTVPQRGADQADDVDVGR